MFDIFTNMIRKPWCVREATFPVKQDGCRRYIRSFIPQYQPESSNNNRVITQIHISTSGNKVLAGNSILLGERFEPTTFGLGLCNLNALTTAPRSC